MESLALFLRERATGHVIDRADSAAISVLKTYQPDLSALRGRVIEGTQRHGKFLDLTAVPAAVSSAAVSSAAAAAEGPAPSAARLRPGRMGRCTW